MSAFDRQNKPLQYVLRKKTIDLLYFWDVYDINVGRSTDYSSRRNVLI